ncbi:hypothetical protein V5O48_019328, partial [Marasmius crinis-equi]
DTSGDVTMAESSSLERIGSVEGGFAPAGARTTAEITEQQPHVVSSAKLASDAETPPKNDGDVDMVKAAPAEQNPSAEGDRAPTEDGKELLDSRTIDAPEASEQPDSAAKMHGDQEVEDQGQGGRDDENIQDQADVPEFEFQNKKNEKNASPGSEATVRMQDDIICIDSRSFCSFVNVRLYVLEEPKESSEVFLRLSLRAREE